ncbi:DNA repair protein RecO [Sulfurisoma sediminicola]|uniref:DNA repair protein RecO n=1 Tax=Sulfurisoma sediminicola TaxID=1381557 RepID=A0A497XDD6_9PROT|nr:DNA repair protein RecO [Sulfurisoma sediminicola]RLJ64980.1 DNA replication and repair protein RecO [Sulfurisoma sediminicola]
MTVRQRVDGAQAFLLHAHPYSETSLIIDVFARDHGRLALLARGARRPRSALRGVLLAFQPLELGWHGGGEVKTLAKAEWMGGLPLPSGRSLLLGYYLNELLLKLLPREDAHPALFDIYAATLGVLATDADVSELRRFEKALLRELGYGLSLERDAVSGQPLRPEERYVYQIERGAVAAGESSEAITYRGKTLLDIAVDDYRDPRTAVESKQLMRQLFGHYLGGQALQSRRVFMELNEL